MEMFIEVIATSGVFAVLFVLLLVYQIKDSRQREEKYISTINSLLASLEILDSVKYTIENIYAMLSKQKLKQKQNNEGEI